MTRSLRLVFLFSLAATAGCGGEPAEPEPRSDAPEPDPTKPGPSKG